MHYAEPRGGKDPEGGLRVVKGIKGAQFTIHNSQLTNDAMGRGNKKLLLSFRGGGRKPEGSVGEGDSLGMLVSAADDDIRACRPE